MDFRQLEYLEAVLDTGTYTGAAAHCHVAQPALWAQVRKLEDEWGFALFERAGRRVRPTTSTLALRGLVRVILGHVAHLAEEVALVRTGESGVTKIGATPYQMTHFFAAAIGHHARRHPRLPLPIVLPISSADPLPLLAEGSIDLVSAVDPASHGFASAPLYDVWPVAVGIHVRKPIVEARDLRDVPLAVMSRAFSSRVVLERICARAGVVPRIVFEDVHADGLLALAGQELATAILVNEALPQRVSLPIARLADRGKLLSVKLWLAWRDEATLSPATRCLRDSILDYAARVRAAASPRAPGASPRRRRRARRAR